MSKSICDATMATLPRHTFIGGHGECEDSAEKCPFCACEPGRRFPVVAVIPGKCNPDPYDFMVCVDCRTYLVCGDALDEWMSA